MKMLRWLPRFRKAARSLQSLKDRETWSRVQIDAWQLDRLNKLWADAIVDVPYYVDLKRQHSLPAQFQSITEFCNTVPLLPKSVLRDRSSELLSKCALPGMWKYSSGTTGRPAGAYWAYSSHRESLQAKYRFYADWGVDVFDRTVFLWGPGTSPMKNWRAAWSRFRQPYLDRLRNRLRVSACDLSKPRLREYLKRMQDFAPTMLYGYSRALYLMAMEAEAMGDGGDGGGGLRFPSLKVIVASSEPAWPHMIEKIEKVFGAPVAREYGALECGIIATDSSIDRTLRVREDQQLVETLPSDEGQYDIIVTVLTNPSFPLIRFAIGDRTDRPLERRDVGFSILSSVAGRNNDFLRTRSGNYVHWVHIEIGVAQTVQRWVRRFSIHQRADGSVHIEVELDDPSRAVEAAEALRAFGQFFEERLEGYPVTVRVVESVAQTAAGKHRIVRSDLHDIPMSEANPAPEQRQAPLITH
jgi:phenylacetate-CoA ligase